MKKALLVALLILATNSLAAQDIIIKMDHEEITAKVLEVTEDVIKYKHWDRQDGPIYNLKKEEIFVIVYKSGEKEHYGETMPKSTSSSVPQTTSTNIVTEVKAPATTVNTTRSTTDTGEKKTEDSPSYPAMGKINIGFGKTPVEGVSTIGLEAVSTIPLAKFGTHGLEFELGSTSIFTNTDIGGGESKSNTYIFSGALNYGIFPIKGLKVSAGVGYFYGWGDTTVDSQFGQSTANFTVNDLFYNGSVEYLFVKSFGVNVRYDEVLGLNFGLSFGL